uniref:Uncharacterized protein n=1 Tax=Romanomermis culicivorax TaxID=13658 RepID=A0A915IBX2_ROMCU
MTLEFLLNFAPLVPKCCGMISQLPTSQQLFQEMEDVDQTTKYTLYKKDENELQNHQGRN